VTIANPEAKRLYEELIKVRAYNKLIRPVKNNSEKLTVYLGLRLTQLLDVVRLKSLFSLSLSEYCWHF
jgi:nicotinic acetylcholine receptor